ncbi:TetR/AcrR family transcriptional regulator [Halieaceae bacterium IMCC14734]|uniref:TetR/AcrR family transcriptional regulator n=1 Tax=Candidatus Litorirhabdus singularis TaxID=2518993 RepID=A0ABT3TJ95_9GAMM|nr:TetR/AcrR family transcriptional regulator [Candidatus Litorirhabdus singularis]MCX2982383.1 TetR/AcrR family transcriptional regulator [Candidatus Litorirhabdus singularis]
MSQSFKAPELPPMALATTMSKGERTRQRIMDAAEPLFSRYGFEGVSLRQISEAALLTEPALYNHFRGKQALYAAVLERALRPLSLALDDFLANGGSPETLPERMTDLLREHPHVAALFQQALQGGADSDGHRLMRKWLEHLLQQGSHSMQAVLGTHHHDPAMVAISVIAMFNLTAGYFQSQAIFDVLAEGDLMAEENIERQKRFLSKMFRVLLIALD